MHTRHETNTNKKIFFIRNNFLELRRKDIRKKADNTKKQRHILVTYEKKRHSKCDAQKIFLIINCLYNRQAKAVLASNRQGFFY